MKMKLLIMIFIGATLNIGCEKEDEFNEVNNEVYQINEITKGGCFEYNPSDSMAIISISNVGAKTYIQDGFGMAEFSADYRCLADDSVVLKGNVLKLFLMPSNENLDCYCGYSWIVKFDIKENKGLKILLYEYENGSYVQKQKMYNHSL
jgi:hypothetical protein